jgi:hypothetical protein
MSLMERAINSLAPEPVALTLDSSGDWHFASNYQPFRTVIDVQKLPVGSWIRIDSHLGVLAITLDGKTVTYERVAISLNDEWICNKVEGTKQPLTSALRPLELCSEASPSK